MSRPGSSAAYPCVIDGDDSSPGKHPTNNTPGPPLQGGHTSLSLGDAEDKLWLVDTTAPSAQPVSPAGGGYDSDCYEIPPPVRHVSPRAAAQPHRPQFDFNNRAQALPWNQLARDHVPANRERQPRNVDDSKIRRFTDITDEELLEYLAHRQVTPAFLREIDLFLQGHPEMASSLQGPDTLRQLSTLRPLQAYLHFLKGYTRPARYLQGIIKTNYFKVPVSFPYCPLSKKYDAELVEFFDGFEFRHDVIDRIDHEVQMGIQKLNRGVFVPLGLRKLISYAVWGNPVDAYKWFEYSYQQDYLPHHYLPEHVMLIQVPSPNTAQPSMTVDCIPKKHLRVRSLMKRADDQGVDVLHVLMTEYRYALVRNGHRRIDIDKLCASAQKRLEQERSYPTDVELVDLIMDDVYVHAPRARHSAPRNTRAQGHSGHRPRHHSRLHADVRVRSGVSDRTAPIRNLPTFLRSQGKDLRDAKNRLQRLYMLESNIALPQHNGGQSELATLRTQRATAERRYVICLVTYQRNANQIDKVTASQLMRQFTREKMSGVTVANQAFLMGMYPKELK